MTREELDLVLEKHAQWLDNKGSPDNMRVNLRGVRLRGVNLRGANLKRINLRKADLREADLGGADLREADLREANLRGADLRKANLREANLRGADLLFADLRGADLRGANLRGADLREAGLIRANLRGADLREADLVFADLRGADLARANLIGADFYIPMACPSYGSFIGWKKARIDVFTDNGSKRVIVKLLVPEDAKRSSATGRKCRCNKAEILAIYDLEMHILDPVMAHVISMYDNTFEYKVGETVTVLDFDEDRFNECAPGIHFFINPEEAINYHG